MFAFSRRAARPLRKPDRCGDAVDGSSSEGAFGSGGRSGDSSRLAASNSTAKSSMACEELASSTATFSALSCR